MAATADLIAEKLRARYPASDTNAGALLQRYRADNGLQRWEDYRNHVTPSALYVDGSSGAVNFTSTPDHASFAFTDLDVRVLLSMETWAPIFLTAHIIDQGLGPPQNSWTYSIHPNKAPRTALYDGTNIVMGLEPNASIPFAGNGEPHWVRSTSDVDNGSGGKDSAYFIGHYDGTLSPSLTQLGNTVTESGTITVFNSTSPIQIPGALALSWFGQVLYAEVRTSINGAVVANPDFRGLAPGTTNFVDGTGKTWTLNGSARIAKASIPFPDAANLFWANFIP